MSLLIATVVSAKTFHCPSGDVQCLIYSINEANVNGQPHNTIRLEGGAYTLALADNDTDGPNGLPSITSTLTIEVKNKATATIARASDAGKSFRLLHVASSGNLTLEDITLTNGHGLASRKGGVLLNNGGVVTLRRSALIDNHAVLDGGGLFNACGTVEIVESTIADNDGLWGPAALVNSDCGTMTIVDSVLTHNRTDADLGTVGGILSTGGTLTILRSRVADNWGGTTGGVAITRGLAVIDSTTFSANGGLSVGALTIGDASVLVTNSAFVGNRSDWYSRPAAIQNRGGTLAVTNSTFAGNAVTGVMSLTNSTEIGVAIENYATLSLLNTTFAENTGHDSYQTSTPRRYDVIFTAAGASTTLQNTIVTHDIQAAVEDCGGPVTSLGNNLILDVAMCAITLQPGDLTGDAGLADFADDGNAGHAHYPLLSTSQAIDAGNDAVCPPRDQIGTRRQGRCDIGAIEFNPRAK